VLTAGSPREWVDRVVRLLDDEALGRRLGALGRGYVEEHYRWDTCLGPFESLLGLAEPSPAVAAVP
jgi:hypothetical protein